ncbi:hypothetical protein K438DRAFT_1986115 [Mycena galopus ATCC 62051]|nr:hypothetical protein K438DRAFT_1986115 [Mycena galopus ATCC 62051]
MQMQMQMQISVIDSRKLEADVWLGTELVGAWWKDDTFFARWVEVLVYSKINHDAVVVTMPMEDFFSFLPDCVQLSTFQPPTSAEVFSTPELLKQILVQLPRRDLVVTVAFVCKRPLLPSPPLTLQRAFFEPDLLASSERVQNPLLRKAFPPLCNAVAESTELAAHVMLAAQPPTQTITIEQAYGGMDFSSGVGLVIAHGYLTVMLVNEGASGFVPTIRAISGLR